MRDSFVGVDYRVSYAQNREDILLSGILSEVKQGFYIDIGANHPTIHSVTKLFYDNGWTGINIEPSPELYQLLQYDRPKDTNLNIGVSDATGEMTLRCYRGREGLSTMETRMQAEYEALGYEFTEATVAVRPLKDICAEHAPSRDIHFLKIDVEGLEYQVLKGNDWKQYRPWVVCVEANHIVKDWVPILKKAQYSELFFDGVNKYYVADEHAALAQQFSFTETMLGIPDIISPALHTAMHRVDAAWQARLAAQVQANAQKEAQINQLMHEIEHSKRIRPAIKQLLRAIDHIIVVRLDKPPERGYSQAIDLPALKKLARPQLVDELARSDMQALYSEAPRRSVRQRYLLPFYMRLSRGGGMMLRRIKHKLAFRRQQP
ncbi:methyltransferase [Candidatus Saccharibacteria bacterium]|nr:MAG: methyltransferase [Candidatus Saccharibacteria bacterium]